MATKPSVSVVTAVASSAVSGAVRGDPHATSHAFRKASKRAHALPAEEVILPGPTVSLKATGGNLSSALTNKRPKLAQLEGVAHHAPAQPLITPPTDPSATDNEDDDAQIIAAASTLASCSTATTPLLEGDEAMWRPKKQSSGSAPAPPALPPAPMTASLPAPVPAQVPASLPAPVQAQVPASIPAPVPASLPAQLPAPVPASLPAQLPAPATASLRAPLAAPISVVHAKETTWPQVASARVLYISTRAGELKLAISEKKVPRTGKALATPSAKTKWEFHVYGGGDVVCELAPCDGIKAAALALAFPTIPHVPLDMLDMQADRRAFAPFHVRINPDFISNVRILRDHQYYYARFNYGSVGRIAGISTLLKWGASHAVVKALRHAHYDEYVKNVLKIKDGVDVIEVIDGAVTGVSYRITNGPALGMASAGDMFVAPDYSLRVAMAATEMDEWKLGRAKALFTRVLHVNEALKITQKELDVTKEEAALCRGALHLAATKAQRAYDEAQKQIAELKAERDAAKNELNAAKTERDAAKSSLEFQRTLTDKSLGVITEMANRISADAKKQ